MLLLALLSGENVSLSKEEFLANLEKQNVKYKVLGIFDRILKVETDKKAIFNDLALTHEVCEFLGNFSDAKKIDWKKVFGKKAAIRAKKIPPKLQKSGTDAEKELGEIFWRKKIKVDFKGKKILRIYLTKRKMLLGKVLWQNVEPFEKRRAHLRPFMTPISLHPKLARTMVNLAHVKKGDKVLDPFCGTGGILIEAGLIGARVYGTDIDSRLVDGCKRNLDFFYIYNKNIKVGDALQTKGKWDAIVTELPFGKSTKLTMKKKELYENFMKLLPHILKKGKYAVISCDEKKLHIPKNLKLLGHFKLYVHGTMNRYFFILWRS